VNCTEKKLERKVELAPEGTNSQKGAGDIRVAGLMLVTKTVVYILNFGTI